MPKKHQELVGLREKCKAILLLVSSGQDFEQIMLERPEFSRRLIEEATGEAVLLDELRGYIGQARDNSEHVPRLRTKWRRSDDAELAALYRGAITLPRIAAMLGRTEPEIIHRIVMLNLEPHAALPYSEPERLARGSVAEISEPIQKQITDGS